MPDIFRKILVTCALPYANGSIHIGHMFEHIQADIWVRYQRMRGHEVWFVSADDAHGTAIMLKSKKLGISPNKLIREMQIEHREDFLNFNISYDNYHSTHSKENLFLLRKFFSCFKKKKLLEKKTIVQFYDDVKKMFLPDRFISGTCPMCQSNKQYGDNCEICGATYEPTDLIDPVSIISKTTPILKNTEHLFFNLPIFKHMLINWVNSSTLQSAIIKKTEEWLISGLKHWCISRDEPYFGFKIPNFPNKYFYVWLDAPIGYISAFKNLCAKSKKLKFDDLWNEKSDYELYHFIGKDIIYFHTLFWPAMLESMSFRKPNGVFVHGYLTINGLKLSKSRGYLITARDWMKHFDSDSLRYYFSSKISNNIDDIDIKLEDFIQKINSDIVNKLINLALRSASFIHKYFNGYLSDNLNNIELYQNFSNSKEKIESYFENREYSFIIRESMKLLDIANQYINQKKPWLLVKKQNRKITDVHMIVTTGINLFRVIMIFLKPILPNLSIKVEDFLNIRLNWDDISVPLLSHKIKKFSILYRRINLENVSGLFDFYE
ncbi:MAG: methionine--tRNA ligase [Buchnera aphidicola (Pentalonia nigronervosa)]|jgi:methionyl-tRNA synthetase|uniref:Methionine--tRNA ligase n=1 Tax=Buchnera aphidicola (Pentalonia nigronervosa) TaxID=1309793 RepID=A0A7H1AZE4_9GAMM|nr:MAG: methionine--tRNA ligase [Buchnera aphidicola (Pentalonia nigronervosa)]